MKITPSVLLSQHTSFRTGGPARFFVEAKSAEDVRSAVSQARSEGLPFLILGEGSNVLISDDGFAGYVIIPKILGIEFAAAPSVEKENDDVLVVAGAGVHWDDLVAETVSRNLSGLENLSWIPGSVGAAPVQNIGAYGAELAGCLEWIEVFDSKVNTSAAAGTGESVGGTGAAIRILSKSETQFGYRDSIFKSPEGRGFVITRVAVRLKKNSVPNISYKDLATFFADRVQKGESPAVAEVRAAVISIRKNKLPDITKLGTAGSFFKNPIISGVQFAELAQKFPGLPSFPAESSGQGFKKIPLAWVLDRVCNLNGFREGNVGLFETQPLALVNFGNATTTEIKNFAQKISDIVREKTNLEIEWEVNLIF